MMRFSGWLKSVPFSALDTAGAASTLQKLQHFSSLVCFGQGSSLLWTQTLRPFYSRPIALTQEGEESG